MCFPLKKTKQKLEEEKNACHTTYIVPKNQQDKIKLNELDKGQNPGVWPILLLMSALIFCTTDQSEDLSPLKGWTFWKGHKKLRQEWDIFSKSEWWTKLLPTTDFLPNLNKEKKLE